MDFTTLKYLAFLAGAALCYRLVPARVRPLFLVIASYWFYWKWSGTMVWLIALATGVAFAAGRALENPYSSKRTAITAAAVSLISGILILFKTEPFWISLVNHDLPLPIGISYYTFKLISYVLDVSWGNVAAERRLIPFMAYISFFPQIVAGPIQRSRDFIEQINRAPDVGTRQIVFGIQRILLGYFKKFVVADNLQVIVDFIYGHIHQSGTPLVLGIWLYPLQIYTDFSGLTDIANGSALLLGIEAPENFQAPFAAANISEYWRRWHITLTSWLTDYVFKPLTVATRDFGSAGLIFSLVVNMVLIGIWHRIVWQFALFGLVHAFYLAFEALTKKKRQRFYKANPRVNSLMNYAGPVFTFQLVALGLICFRSETLGDVFYVASHLTQGVGGVSLQTVAFLNTCSRNFWVGLGGYVLAEFADYFRRHENDWAPSYLTVRWSRWSVYSCTTMAVLLVLFLLLSGGSSRNPFVYAVF